MRECHRSFERRDYHVLRGTFLIFTHVKIFVLLYGVYCVLLHCYIAHAIEIQT